MRDFSIDKRNEEENFEDLRKKTEEEFLLRVGEFSQEINQGLDIINKDKAVNK